MNKSAIEVAREVMAEARGGSVLDVTPERTEQLIAEAITEARLAGIRSGIARAANVCNELREESCDARDCRDGVRGIDADEVLEAMVQP